mgnify:CR=1 FL=1
MYAPHECKPYSLTKLSWRMTVFSPSGQLEVASVSTHTRIHPITMNDQAWKRKIKQNIVDILVAPHVPRNSSRARIAASIAPEELGQSSKKVHIFWWWLITWRAFVSRGFTDQWPLILAIWKHAHCWIKVTMWRIIIDSDWSVGWLVEGVFNHHCPAMPSFFLYIG